MSRQMSEGFLCFRLFHLYLAQFVAVLVDVEARYSPYLDVEQPFHVFGRDLSPTDAAKKRLETVHHGLFDRLLRLLFFDELVYPLLHEYLVERL